MTTDRAEKNQEQISSKIGHFLDHSAIKPQNFYCRRFLCPFNQTSRKSLKIKPSQKCLSLLGLIFGPFRLVRIKPTTHHRIKNLFAQNCSAHSQLPGDTPLPLGIRRVKNPLCVRYFCSVVPLFCYR